MNIRHTEDSRWNVVELLNHTLANTYRLLIKTRQYHWDAVSPQFRSLRAVLKTQYKLLAEDVYHLAERVRALGGDPLETAEVYLQHASVKEFSRESNAAEIIRRLTTDYDLMMRTLREHICLAANEFEDEETSDFLTGLMEHYEKAAARLRLFLDS